MEEILDRLVCPTHILGVVVLEAYAASIHSDSFTGYAFERPAVVATMLMVFSCMMTAHTVFSLSFSVRVRASSKCSMDIAQIGLVSAKTVLSPSVVEIRIIGAIMGLMQKRPLVFNISWRHSIPCVCHPKP